MSMKIIKSKLWKQYPLIKAITCSFLLDPSILLSNPDVYVLINRKPCAYAAVVKHQDSFELKAVYTIPQNRNKGYMSALLTHVVKIRQNLFLICAPRLVSFYKKFGFQKTTLEHAPSGVYYKITLINAFNKLTGAPPYVMMFRNRVYE